MDMKIESIDLVPPDSLVIIRVENLSRWVRTDEYARTSDHLTANYVQAVFIDKDADLELLTDHELEYVGLRRIRH